MEHNLKNKTLFLHILVVTFVLVAIMIVITASVSRNRGASSSQLKPQEEKQETLYGEVDKFNDATGSSRPKIDY